MNPPSSPESFTPLGRRDLCKVLGMGAVALAAAPIFDSTVQAAGTAAPGSKECEIGYKDGKFVLPPLPYAYNALEPVIDEKTVHLHHDKHQQGYVDGANKAMAAIAALGADTSLLGHLNSELAFNVSGAFLHLLYWNNMKPGGGSKPSGEFAAALNASFGSQAQFEALFAATAKGVQGSGWGLLGYEALSKKLVVLSAEKHQNLTIQSITPLLALDVWEHAYYLKYANLRADYVKAFMTIINYDDVAARYAKATAA